MSDRGEDSDRQAAAVTEARPSPFLPVQASRQPKAPESVADRIRTAIIDGDIAIDAMLPTEAQLAVSFGVSRPTIREALRILESERFIHISRGSRGGVTVLEPTSPYAARSLAHILRFQKATLGDIYDARIELEGAAAQFAARNNPADAGKALRACVEREFAMIDDLPHVIEAISSVHLVILQQCGNLTLKLVGSALQDMIRHQMTVVYAQRLREGRDEFRREKLSEGFQRHEQLAELIARGKAEEACALWKANMHQTREFWVPGNMPLQLPPLMGAAPDP